MKKREGGGGGHLGPLASSVIEQKTCINIDSFLMVKSYSKCEMSIAIPSQPDCSIFTASSNPTKSRIVVVLPISSELQIFRDKA